VDWSTLPPYVIGRRAYDNALVDWAFHNAVLVDTTETIKAVHQTLVDGNHAGHSSIHADNEYNANLPGGGWDHGSTSMAHYRTVVNNNKELVVVDQGGQQQWPAADAMRYMGLHTNWNSIPEPLIVVFGNDGYLPLMLNLLCNLRNFPRMLPHLLMVVPDTKTADALLAVGLPMTVAVTPLDAIRGDFDYYASEYRDILIWRANALFTLLGRGKKVLCMEADVIIYQDLLEQPEIIGGKLHINCFLYATFLQICLTILPYFVCSGATDLTLFWDHTVYGAGFVVFAPTDNAKAFYAEVLQTLILKTDMDNEAISRLIAEHKNPFTHTKLDRCRYRSGASFKFPDQYTDCTQLPVVQQLNWVVGLPAKVELAKAHGGWFLTTDNPTKCAKRDLRAVIMTMNRAHSLTRLIDSIQLSDALIDIHVSVDIAADATVDAAVLLAIENAQVKWGERGFFTYKVHAQQIGIFGNWVDSWEAELYQPDLYKAVVLLEDDLQLSPHFAKWFIGAHEMYASQDSRIGSVTGQRAQLVARGSAQFNSLSELNSAFAYRLMACQLG
jgi:Nucleotide-diphospho-sugar transferase